jgi:hypothetical protein
VIAYKLVDIVIGLRVPEEEEREGLDITSHGESAYHLNSKDLACRAPLRHVRLERRLIEVPFFVVGMEKVFKTRLLPRFGVSYCNIVGSSVLFEYSAHNLRM